MSMHMDSDGSAYGFCAVECGVKVNDDGTFGVAFDHLEPMALSAMLHPGLIDVVMPRIWEEADRRGISLR